MDAVDHPLDWWAYAGYTEVMRRLGCTKAQARHKVRQKIKDCYRLTGDPIWKPVGHRGYRLLRQAILAGQTLDNELR